MDQDRFDLDVLVLVPVSMMQIGPVWVAMGHLFMLVSVRMTPRYYFRMLVSVMAIVMPMNVLVFLILVRVNMFVPVFVAVDEKK